MFIYNPLKNLEIIRFFYFLWGIGQGILTPALYLATNTYFKKRLTLAVSFSVTGTSLSPIFMPQVCNLLLSLYGTKYTVLILFAISLHALAGALLLRPLRTTKKRKLEETEHMLDDLEKNTKQLNGTTKEVRESVFWVLLYSEIILLFNYVFNGNKKPITFDKL